MGAGADRLAAVEEPWRVCLELAWESCRNGSVGVGSVITDPDGVIVAHGRSRAFESEPGPSGLADTALAHAEVNALAGMRTGIPLADHVLWTSLEPCLLCAGAIVLAQIGTVRYLARDPLWEWTTQLPRLSPFVAERWPSREGPRRDELAAFAMLVPLHLFAYWVRDGAVMDAHRETEPAVAALAVELAESEELVRAAAEGLALAEVLDRLWARLRECAA